MTTIDLQSLIPNNVGLGENRQLQRALEHWQPAFLNWWDEMGPSDFKAREVYLRTAVGVDAQGWASYGYTRRFRGRIRRFAHLEIPHRPADIDHARDSATNVAREDIIEMRLDPRDLVLVWPHTVEVSAIRAREQIG